MPFDGDGTEGLWSSELVHHHLGGGDITPVLWHPRPY